MQASQIPTKFNIPWANGAAPPFIRTIPQASQIGLQNGAASLTDGWPPLTFLQVAAGGVPPFGADANGILNQMTAWIRWASAGAPINWDSAFSAAIGGYPIGAVVQSPTTFGLWWICLADNNGTNPDSGGANWLGANLFQTIPMAEVYFAFSSGTACTLQTLNGGLVWINGLNYAVPSAGLNFSSGGSLSGNTLYYAYVRVAGSGLAGDFSTTSYAKASNGMPQKIGDATRTCVGMIYTTAGGAFIDQDGNRQVLSYFNRQLKRSRSQFSTQRFVSSASFVEINTEIRNFFLCWASQNVEWSTAGQFGVSNPSISTTTQMSFDSAAAELEQSNCIGFGSAPAGGESNLNIAGVKVGLSEGLHYATLFGATNQGSSSGGWTASSALGSAVTLINIKVYG